jgi:hypothetical protein
VGHPAAAISGVDPVVASIRRRRRGEALNAAVRRRRPSVGDVDPQTRRPPGGSVDPKKLDSSVATASTQRPEDAASPVSGGDLERLCGDGVNLTVR